MKRSITSACLLLCLYLSASAQCWKMISTGAEHSLGVKTDGTLWAWGNNADNQLGDSTLHQGNVAVPHQIGTATDWKYVTASNGTRWR